jgi:hypothetical protein
MGLSKSLRSRAAAASPDLPRRGRSTITLYISSRMNQLQKQKTPARILGRGLLFPREAQISSIGFG